MREYKFRGKSIKTKEWVYGYYWTNENGNHFIRQTIDLKNCFTIADVEVILETVGQYTLLKDLDKNNIYMGDILKIDDNIRRIYDLKDIMYVDFIEGSFYLKAEKEIKWSMLRCLPALVNVEGNIRAEVIGNIHDNPELLGGNNGYTKDI